VTRRAVVPPGVVSVPRQAVPEQAAPERGLPEQGILERGVLAGTPVAVTGSSGFIGSRLATALAGEGAAVTRHTRADPALGPDGRPAPGLRAARVVYHLATSIHPSTAQRHPEWVAADRAAFGLLLDRLAWLADPPLVVLASSGGYVYDPKAPQPFAEDAPLHADTAYGRAKLELEGDLAARRDVLPGIALRLSNVYGPGQHTSSGHGVIAHWARAARAGRPLRVIGDPATVLDFVHVTDVAGALCRLGSAAVAGRDLPAVLNIGSGEPTSLAGLLHLFSRVAGRDLPAEQAAGRGFDRQDTVLDVRAAARALGWRPRISLAAGLRGVWRQTPGPAASGAV